MEAKKGESWGSLRASSPIWASEASLARTRERAAKRGSFAYPNRRACSQANIGAMSRRFHGWVYFSVHFTAIFFRETGSSICR